MIQCNRFLAGLLKSERANLFGRLLVLIAVAAGVAAGLVLFRDELTLDSLAEREAAIRAFRQENPVLVYATAFAVYVGVTGLSLPGSVPLSLTIGWYFGFWRAVLLVSFASTAGATIALLVSRYLFRNAVQRRFGDRLETFNAALERDGTFYLFTLRLIPPVPYFLINLVMGLTPMPVRTFWWVSQLGMLPSTCILVYLASQVPDMQTLAEQGPRGLLTFPLLAALTLLGLFPLLARLMLTRFRPTAAQEEA